MSTNDPKDLNTHLRSVEYFGNKELPNIQDIQKLVRDERLEQFLKWGNQSAKPDFIWVLILMEEFGETIAEIMFGDVEKTKTELIQMTAVSNAWAEAVYDRGIVQAENKQDGFATGIFMLFTKFGELAKAMLEQEFEKAVGLTHDVMKEVYFTRQQIEQDFINDK